MKCELCEVDVPRTEPAGPKGEQVCYKCAQKDGKAFSAFILGRMNALGLDPESLSGEKVAAKVAASLIEIITRAGSFGIRFEKIEVKTLDESDSEELAVVNIKVNTEQFDRELLPKLQKAMGVTPKKEKTPEESNQEVLRALRDAFAQFKGGTTPDGKPSPDVAKTCDA